MREIYYKLAADKVTRTHAQAAADMIGGLLEKDEIVLPHGMTHEQIKRSLGVLFGGLRCAR